MPCDEAKFGLPRDDLGIDFADLVKDSIHVADAGQDVVLERLPGQDGEFREVLQYAQSFRAYIPKHQNIPGAVPGEARRRHRR